MTPGTPPRRQRAQTMAIAALSVVALVGALAMVVDTGIFMVIQRQLQASADAGALAGAWYPPVCSDPTSGCKVGAARDVATRIAQANGNTIAALCLEGPTVDPPKVGTLLNRPKDVNTIVVTVKCRAGYSFGRILGLGDRLISASAAAAIGDRTSTGDITTFSLTPPGGTPVPHVARLIE